MRRASVIQVLCLAAVLAVCFTGTAAAVGSSSPHLAGTWSGKYSGAFSGTFTIKWKETNSRLRGTIALSYPHGTYGITGSVKDGKIKFGAVDAGATYKGTVSGRSMSGTYMSGRGPGTWSAHRTGS